MDTFSIPTPVKRSTPHSQSSAAAYIPFTRVTSVLGRGRLFESFVEMNRSRVVGIVVFVCAFVAIRLLFWWPNEIESPASLRSSPPQTYESLLATIVKSCGAACVDDSRVLECDRLFDSTFDFAPLEWPPPKQIPDSMRDAFTMGGRVSVVPYYFQQKYSGGDAHENKWTRELIETISNELMKKTHEGSYGVETTNAVKSILMDADLGGKSVLVIGSERPWIETICLLAGAAHVTTLEYGKIVSEHEKISTMTPTELSKHARFDVVVSFSSIEHSGLGRYGDSLNPWGDVITTAKARCVTKNGGKLILGLPHDIFKDALFWNAHRVYGKLRWPLVLKHWRQTGFKVVDGAHAVAVAIAE